MKLTIGIPNYNGGNLLINTINSCLNIGLDKKKYEILVLDNCSTDNSQLNIIGLQKKIINLKLIKNNKNYGRIGNWNRVLEEAKGEYILFLMIGDLLEKYDYNSLFENFKESIAYVFSFYQGDKKKIHNHWAKDLNIELSLKEIQKKSFLTLGNNFGLPPLQSHFFKRDIIIKNKIKFDEKIPFLADLKFLNEYISNFEKIIFLDISNIIWGTGLGKFTYKNQLSMCKDFLSYYPYAFQKFLGRDINIFYFKVYLTLHIFFIYINNFRMKNNGFTFSEMFKFIKNDLKSYFYIFIIIFEPFYVLYLYINTKNNFKYALKF